MYQHMQRHYSVKHLHLGENAQFYSYQQAQNNCVGISNTVHTNTTEEALVALFLLYLCFST